MNFIVKNYTEKELKRHSIDNYLVMESDLLDSVLGLTWEIGWHYFALMSEWNGLRWQQLFGSFW
jgi:hypothetical protein